MLTNGRIEGVVTKSRAACVLHSINDRNRHKSIVRCQYRAARDTSLPAAAARATTAAAGAPTTTPPPPLLSPQHHADDCNDDHHRLNHPQATTSAHTAAVPWSLVHARVQADAKRRRLFPSGANVLVAVSGGQDSLCLLQLLLDLRPALGLGRLVVAHCDHRAHARSAAAAEFVRALAAARGLEHVEATAGSECDDYSSSSGSSSVTSRRSEADMREWRYAALARMARARRCSFVAVGHTLTDRAETLVLNALRGAGATGLSALRWARPLVEESGSSSSSSDALMLVRPLLGVTRRETGAECARRGLTPQIDPTNSDERFARNAVRARVLPAMASVAPAAERRIAALAEALGAEADFLESAAAAALERAARPPPPPQQNPDPNDAPSTSSSDSSDSSSDSSDSSSDGRQGSDAAPPPALDRATLAAEHVAVQRRALRAWLRAALGAAPTLPTVEEARALLAAPQRSRGSTLRGGFCVQVDGPLLVLERRQGRSVS